MLHPWHDALWVWEGLKGPVSNLNMFKHVQTRYSLPSTSVFGMEIGMVLSQHPLEKCHDVGEVRPLLELPRLFFDVGG